MKPERSGAVNEEASGAFRLLKSDGISGSLMLAPPDSTALDRSLSAGPATWEIGTDSTTLFSRRASHVALCSSGRCR